MWKNTRIEQGKMYGVVIYIGRETRLDYNQKSYHQKVSSTNRTVTAIYLIQLFLFLSFTMFGVFIWASPTTNILRNLNENFIYYSITLSVACKSAVDLFRFFSSSKINSEKENNIFVKNPEIIEDLGSIQYMLLDKTGTLTKNSFNLLKVNTLNENIDLANDEHKLEEKVKQIYKKLESGSELLPDESQSYLLILGMLVCNEVYTYKVNENLQFKGTSKEDIAIIHRLSRIKVELL